jgi:predicted component of type VI protein secretion system
MLVNLVLFKIDGTQKAVPLPSTSSVIGRRHDCDLQIALKEVSKRHCQITMDNSSLRVRDLGSTNGTFVNNERIDETDVRAGDYIRIGPLTFQIQIDGDPEEASAPSYAEEPAAPAAGEPTGEPGDSFLELDNLGGDDGDLGGDNLDDEFAGLDGDADDSFLDELGEL